MQSVGMDIRHSAGEYTVEARGFSLRSYPLDTAAEGVER